MSRVLIVAEHLNGQLNAATARCVSCAAALAPETIDVLVLSADGAAVAAQAARIAAVGRVTVSLRKSIMVVLGTGRKILH